MGNSGTRLLPAASVLKLVSSDAPVTITEPPEGDEELESSLKALGVESTGVSVTDARRCWRLVAHEDFWRSHHTAHPKKKRVKTWLFVHGKFRTSAASLVQSASLIEGLVVTGFDGQAVRAAAEAVESSFKTLVKKIEQHSEFEDTQLFRFFREHLPDIRDDIRDLEADHSERQLEENVSSSLTALKDEATKHKAGVSEPVERTERLATEAVASLQGYAAGLEAHLQREERTLVARWLNLTPELYSTYRTYLVGKYRIAY